MADSAEPSPSAAAAYVPLASHRAQVEAVAGFGVPEAGIAQVLEIDPANLRSFYARELDSGELKANARVAESLYRKAIGDGREGVTAAIFWLKTRARWKETLVSEVTHDVADPVRELMDRISERGRRIHD